MGTLVEILCAVALFASTLKRPSGLPPTGPSAAVNHRLGPSGIHLVRLEEPRRPGRHVCRKEGQRGTGLLLPLDC
jgi:hypothetical protein